MPGRREQGRRGPGRQVPLVGGDAAGFALEDQGDTGLLTQAKRDAVGQVEGHEQALEQVVPVSPAADDAQPEVQLGRRREAEPALLARPVRSPFGDGRRQRLSCSG